MRSLFKIIETYLENPQDKDMERVLNRESDKRNVLKMYEKIQDLERQLAEAREIQNQLGKWVSEYCHCMRTVDYCGSLEDANEMDQYLEQLKEQG